MVYVVPYIHIYKNFKVCIFLPFTIILLFRSLSLSLFLPFEWRWLCSIDHEIMKKTTTTKQQHLLDACSNWNETSNANIHLFMWSIWMLMSNLKRKSMSQVNCCWLKSLWFFFSCLLFYIFNNEWGKSEKKWWKQKLINFLTYDRYRYYIIIISTIFESIVKSKK